MTRTKPCATCGDDMPRSAFVNCKACREPNRAGVCKSPGCEKKTFAAHSGYCDGCLSARRLGGAVMDDLAELRHLVDSWNAHARRQTLRGPARLWR